MRKVKKKKNVEKPKKVKKPHWSEVRHVRCAALRVRTSRRNTDSALCVGRGTVVAGYRHWNCLQAMQNIDPDFELDQHDPYCQGFLDSEGKYLTRQDAAKLAFECGQTEHPLHSLTSEDIY